MSSPMFAQEEIDYSSRKLARGTDPATSIEAARKLDAGRAGSMRRALLESYLAGPMTAERASSVAGFGPGDGAWKRVSDLLNLELLRDTGRTRVGSSGRQQRILEITELGRSTIRGAGA